MAEDSKININKLVIEAGVKSKDDFYAEMKRLLKLADWFGMNLDAFSDALTGGCGEVDPKGKVFVWKGHAAAKASLGDQLFDTIIEIFKNDDQSGHEAFAVELE